jgi:hypothetical protein
MKKILVLLLVLATAAGLFALDGEWSLGGKVEINAFVNFNEDPAATGEPITTRGWAYNQPYGEYGNLGGTLNANYTMDALTLGLEFQTYSDAHIVGKMIYDGGNFKMHAETKFDSGAYLGEVDRLWGYYDMLSGLVHLEVAFNSRDTEWWASNKVAAFVSGQGVNRFGPLPDKPWFEGHTFAKVDHNNFLLTSVELENLSFGIILPYVFGDGMNFGGNGNNPSWPQMIPASQGTAKNKYRLLDDVMKNMAAGFKFTMQPVEVAGQFQMGTYGVYFGGKADISALEIGLSFMGIFKEDVAAGNPYKQMKFGGGIGFEPGAFGAKLNGFYAAQMGDHGSCIGIEPEFFYNVIPTHLRFQAKVGFYFDKPTKASNLDVVWAVEPQLFWNFLGTGAGGYYGVSTGMIVRYRLVSESDYAGMWSSSNVPKNALDVTFKWAF